MSVSLSLSLLDMDRSIGGVTGDASCTLIMASTEVEW